MDYGFCKYKHCKNKIFLKKANDQQYCCRQHYRYAQKLRRRNSLKEEKNDDIVINCCSVCCKEIRGDYTTICIDCYKKLRNKKIPYYYVGELV